jgi:HTH-type transcriptional regulator/antitoxin HipB
MPVVDGAPRRRDGHVMDELDLERDSTPVTAQISQALRVARRRRGLSQREFALQLGVSKSRLARLESDAGAQSVEMVCQVLMAADFRLEVIDVSGTEPPKGDTSAATVLGLCNAGGRRLPAHLNAYRVAYPPLYWFVRNGGWNTSKAFPAWTYERRPLLRAPTPRGQTEAQAPEIGPGRTTRW